MLYFGVYGRFMTSRQTKRASAKIRPSARMRLASMPVTRAVAKGAHPSGPLSSGRALATRPAAGAASPRSDEKRLAELKAKLGDKEYMNGAILRIATVLSARLTLR